MKTWNLKDLRLTAYSLREDGYTARKRGNYPKYERNKHVAEFLEQECQKMEKAMQAGKEGV